MHLSTTPLAILAILTTFVFPRHIGQVGLTNLSPNFADHFTTKSTPAPLPNVSPTMTTNIHWYVLKPEWDPWRFCEPTNTLVENSTCVPAMLDCKSIYEDFVISRDWFCLSDQTGAGENDAWVQVITRGSCSVQVYLGDGVQQASVSSLDIAVRIEAALSRNIKENDKVYTAYGTMACVDEPETPGVGGYNDVQWWMGCAEGYD